MGVFDSVMAKCPECGAEVEFQSKSGPCMLTRYDLDDVPSAVVQGTDEIVCDKCLSFLTLHPTFSIWQRLFKDGTPTDDVKTIGEGATVYKSRVVKACPRCHGDGMDVAYRWWKDG